MKKHLKLYIAFVFTFIKQGIERRKTIYTQDVGFRSTIFPFYALYTHRIKTNFNLTKNPGAKLLKSKAAPAKKPGLIFQSFGDIFKNA